MHAYGQIVSTEAHALADQLGARSLALVAFGTGVGGFPLDRAADAVQAVIDRKVIGKAVLVG